MKLVTILIFLFNLQLSATVYSQQISLSVENAPLQEVMKSVGKQSGFSFIFEGETLKQAKPITVHLIDQNLEETLEVLFVGQPLSYEIKDNFIIVSLKKNKQDDNSELILQNNLIKGRVTDTLGNPLSNVSVSIKGNKSKVVTNASGVFELNFTLSPVTLVFSFIGMKTQEIIIASNSLNLHIVMKANEIAIDDVIITGYSNIRKESFTGTYTQITKEQLLQVTSNNLISALQVFDPSLRIMQNTDMGSDPNSLPEFYIRGQSGFPGVKELDDAESSSVSQFSLQNNPNLPVFIMDGFEVGLEKIFDIDINRIKGITILKDAAATAIYGSRASNGVIVIETLDPRPGEFRLSYSGNYSITNPDLSSYNMMNAQEKLDAEVSSGLFLPASDSPDYGNALEASRWLYQRKKNEILKGVDTYWLSQPLSTMFNQKHTFYLEGGGEAIRLGVDFRYDEQNGVMKESSRNRIGTGITLQYKHNNLQIRNQTSFDIISAKDSPYGKFRDYSHLQPYYAKYNEDGTAVKEFPNYSGRIDINPLNEATLGSYSKNGYKDWTNNLSANWHLNKFLFIRGQFSVNYKASGAESFVDPESLTFLKKDLFSKGELSLSDTEAFNWNSNLFASYNRLIGANHINFTLGLNGRSTNNNHGSSQYRGFSNADYYSPAYAFEIIKKPSFIDNKTRLLGGFTTLNYSFDNIYLLDASFRMDGSSEFGTDRKWAPFWSFGTGINLHNTSLLSQNKNINIFRLTGNIGQTGKSNFSPFMARNTYEFMLDDWYPTGIGANLIYMGNNALTWEKQVSWNLGTDISILNRYTMEFNYYKKTTFDLITDVSLPSSSGFVRYKDNIGKVINKGFEIKTTINALNTRDFTVILFGNLAHNRNKIVEIAESLKNYNDRVNDYYKGYRFTEDPFYMIQDNENNLKYAKPFMKYEEGNSLTTIYGMKSLGINPANGQEVFMKRDGSITYEWSAIEQQPIGNTEPWAQGSFGLNTRYKRVSLYTTFLYEWGGDQYNQTLVNNVENVNLSYYNADKRVLTERWQKPGDISALKSIQDRYLVTRPTSRFIQRNNYVTLNSLSVGYDFDPLFIKKYKFNALRLSLNMNDIARFSTIKQEMGLDYPYAKTFTFTLNATF